MKFFFWTNFFSSCTDCNRRKKENFGRQQRLGDNTTFPIIVCTSKKKGKKTFSPKRNKLQSVFVCSYCTSNGSCCFSSSVTSSHEHTHLIEPVHNPHHSGTLVPSKNASTSSSSWKALNPELIWSISVRIFSSTHKRALYLKKSSKIFLWFSFTKLHHCETFFRCSKWNKLINIYLSFSFAAIYCKCNYLITFFQVFFN